MPPRVMRREATDNEYLHRDFHGALSVGLDYLAGQFGPAGVREYLRRFTRTYYAPVREAIARDGLHALAGHLRRVYAAEQAEVELEISENELLVRVPACPAVTHMRAHGYAVSEHFIETTRTVNEALVEDTPITAELLDYDPQTGRSVQRFRRTT